MPRCMSSTSSDDRSASRYLARRPSPVTLAPVRRRTKSLGNGQRKSGRLASTLRKRAPSMAGARPRRTVSTSGSSGMREAFTLWREFAGAVIAPIGRPRYGPDELERAARMHHFRNKALKAPPFTLPPVGGEGRCLASARRQGGGPHLAPNLLKHPPPLAPPRHSLRSREEGKKASCAAKFLVRPRVQLDA